MLAAGVFSQNVRGGHHRAPPLSFWWDKEDLCRGGVQHHCWKKRDGGYGGWAPRRQGTVKNICDQASICPSRYFHPVTPAPMHTLILIQARPVPLSALLRKLCIHTGGEGGEIVWANKESIVQVSCFWCRTNVPQEALRGPQSPPGLRSPWCLRCRG